MICEHNLHFLLVLWAMKISEICIRAFHYFRFLHGNGMRALTLSNSLLYCAMCICLVLGIDNDFFLILIDAYFNTRRTVNSAVILCTM